MKRFNVEGVYYERERLGLKKNLSQLVRALNFFAGRCNSHVGRSRALLLLKEISS